MGEVYRATDTRLHRVVAIKVIGRTHSHEPELRVRFRVEAEAIAALTHPHICRLYDVGQHEDVEFLVLEHLEGETLAARLARGRLPLDEAIGYAIAIAGALDQAHRQGIVHRDVKPANVMLTRAGPKLLDFGLARLRAPLTVVVAGQSTVARAPGLTEPGGALGTWQYMAPEQVRGEHVDARTDVFALGSLIYEMLTGRRPFVGATHHDLVVAILEHQPPSLTSVDATIPIALDRIVVSCLAKDPSDRWQSAGDVRRALDALQSVASSASTALIPRVRRRLVASALLSVLLLAALALPFAWSTVAPTRVDKVVRSVVPLSPEELWIGSGTLAFAPDGKSFVYDGRTAGRGQLYRRTLDGERGEPIAGTERGYGPFFSPDGEWLGFSLPDRLMKVPALGGRPVEISNTPAHYGASWGTDDTIVFSPRAQTGLLRVPASGGATTTVTTLTAEDEGNDHRYPQTLPGGRAIIFTVGTGPEDAARIVALDLRSGSRTELVRGSASARYVTSGHLVYAREAQLFAMPFDRDRLTVTGTPVRIASGVAEETDGAPEYAFSPEGDLVYVPGTSGGPQIGVSLVDMKGAAEATAIPTGVGPRVSPDGRRIAVTVGGAKNNVWLYDRDRKTTTRMTFGRYHAPVWMPDGRLTLAHGGPGDLRIVRRASDGSPDEELVPASGRAQFPESWTPDGRTLFYRRFDRGQWDLWQVSPGVSPPEPFLASTFNELNSRVSPDGSWLAYASDENGRDELYVRSLRGDRVQREQVSVNSASYSVWAPDGRRIYYRGAVPGATALGLWAATMEGATTLRVGSPRLLFSNPGFEGSFDITPAGTHFVMVTVDRTPARHQINLVLNSLAALRRTASRD
jgi:serine/threonine-protein kinase